MRVLRHNEHLVSTRCPAPWPARYTIDLRGLCGLTIAAVILATSLPAFGQNRLGATDAQGPLRAPAPPSFEAADTQHRQRADLTATRLLETARKDRAEGQPEIAQRVLETLIARYPDSSSAEAARRELFEIYATDRRIAPQNQPQAKSARDRPPAASPPRVADQPAPPPSTGAETGPPPAAAVPEAPASPWRTSVSSFRRLQDDLRNGVGDRVFFGAGSSELGSRARAVITAQAGWMLSRPDVEAIVEGHADDASAGADNERLAAQRAGAVRERLIAEGVEPDRLRVAPLGARDPVAVCSDSDCATQNRRAILQVGVRRPQGNGNSGTQVLPAAPAGDLRR